MLVSSGKLLIGFSIGTKIMQTCCVTGNRPQKFPWKYGKGKKYKTYLAEMAKQIEKLIERGYTYFISGGALGVDQDFAEAVLRAKQAHAEITLEIAIPCKTQAARWSKDEQLRYRSILECADKITILSEHYTPSCMQRRNEYMVDKADLVLAYWNSEESGGTWYTINCAKQKEKLLIINRLD